MLRFPTPLLVLGLSALLLTSPAHAWDRDEQDRTFGALSQALGALGVNITGERYVDDGGGSRDLEFVSNSAFKDVVSAVRQTYSKRRTLPGGIKIAGYATLDRRGSFLITFRLGASDHIVELRPRGEQAKGIVGLIRGTSRDRGFERDGPLRPLPPAIVPKVRP